MFYHVCTDAEILYYSNHQLLLFCFCRQLKWCVEKKYISSSNKAQTSTVWTAVISKCWQKSQSCSVGNFSRYEKWLKKEEKKTIVNSLEISALYGITKFFCKPRDFFSKMSCLDNCIYRTRLYVHSHLKIHTRPFC